MVETSDNKKVYIVRNMPLKDSEDFYQFNLVEYDYYV